MAQRVRKTSMTKKKKVKKRVRKRPNGTDKGYVKFNAICTGTKPVPVNQLTQISKYRNKLYALGLIGIYTEGPAKGIGFGNVSRKMPSGNMIVTGTRTGGIKRLMQSHYCLVTESFPSKNRVSYIGPIKPTSECMTHDAIYKIDKSAKVVIHVHNMKLWKKLLNKVPTTRKNVTYGTPAMAKEISRLFKETNLKERKILVTAGHTEGIFTFGRTFEEAFNNLLDYFYEKEKA